MNNGKRIIIFFLLFMLLTTTVPHQNIKAGGDYHPLVPPVYINICVFNESNCSQPIGFDIIISNREGNQVYEEKNCEYCVSIPMQLCPYGEDTIILISSDDYNSRLFYVDLLPSLGNFTMKAYLPPKVTEGEEPECGFRVEIDTVNITNPTIDATIPLTYSPDTITSVMLFNESMYGGQMTLRTYTNSKTVTNPAVDLVIPLTYTLEDIISVEIFDDTLYGTYGGWVFISEDNFTIGDTTVTINSSILDENSTVGRVYYYYEYYEDTVETGGWIEVSNDDYSYTATELTIDKSVLNSDTTLAKAQYEYDYCPLKAASYLYQLSVYNRYDQPIDGAKIIVKRYMECDGVFSNMSIVYSDGAGLADVYLIPGALYQFNVTKDTFESDLSYWTPTPVVFVHRFVLTYDEEEPIDYIQPVITVVRAGTTIYANYTDVMDGTINVTMYIYYINATTGNETLVTTFGSENSTVNNKLEGTNLSLAYKVVIVSNHTQFGLQTLSIVLDIIVVIDVTTTLNSLLDTILGKAGPFIWTNVILFLAFTVMMFHADKKHAGKYLILIGGIMAFVAFIGFGDALAGTIPVLFVLIGVILEWINAGR